MNLAIVIGISEYNNQKDLPACKNDANYFYNILNLSQKYSDILYIHEKTDSDSIMNKIEEYIKKHSSEKIKEVLLYFSGHGYYNEEEFYFCTSNINVSMINSTSIINSQLDMLIRGLSPEVYVKIIDACESGSLYIKNINDRKNIFEKNKNEFKSCYFFSSSECNQSSYANGFISDFTKSILEVIKKEITIDKIDNVKYRHILNALSDEYESNDRQKPFYVMQGNLSDIFVSKNDELDTFLQEMNFSNHDKIDDCNSIENNVETMNKLIPAQSAAINVKEELIAKISSNLRENVSEILKNYEYNEEIISITTDSVFNKVKVGEWLSENKNKYFVFAEERYSKKYNNPFDSLNEIFNQDKIEYQVSGFKLNADEKNSVYQLELKSPNHLPKYCCQLVVIYSLTKIYLFYYFNYSYPKNWQDYLDYVVSDKMNIATVIINDKQSLDSAVNDIYINFQLYCEENLKKYLDILLK